jgi:hypothetical protein
VSYGISWGDLAKPVGRWLLRRLPTVVFAKFYSLGDLREDIMIILDSSQPLKVYLPMKWRAPSVWFSAKVLNSSPYLDIRVKRVSLTLSATPGELGEIFADVNDWDEFDLRRGESRDCQLICWLNQFQTEIVRGCQENRISVEATVYVCAESPFGVVVAWKLFRSIHLAIE